MRNFTCTDFFTAVLWRRVPFPSSTTWRKSVVFINGLGSIKIQLINNHSLPFLSLLFLWPVTWAIWEPGSYLEDSYFHIQKQPGFHVWGGAHLYTYDLLVGHRVRWLKTQFQVTSYTHSSPSLHILRGTICSRWCLVRKEWSQRIH